MVIAVGGQVAGWFIRSLALIAAVLSLGACGQGADRAATPSNALPQTEGTLTVAGLRAPVVVVRDRAGVPHITAENQADLFFAQGFVQAQDRLFQMDLWRRSVQGRLSEVLGSNFIERDAMTRRIQFRGDLAEEWSSYGEGLEQIARSFTAGINAWIDASADQWPDEFRLAGWRPEHWRPEDLLNRTDAFVASAGAQDEVFRARVAAALGVRQLDALFPDSRPRVAGPVDLTAVTYRLGEALLGVGTSPFFSGFAAPYASGTNVWAVPASRTGTGAPLLATDPHRRFEAPALRYVVHLSAPGWHVAGATAPWLPGVVIGHNEQVAWAMAAARDDLQDLVVERVNPANEHEVWRNGRWVAMTVEPEVIQVKGSKEPFRYDRLYTENGPVVGVDRTRHLAYALRWTGAAPGTAAELAAPWLNRAVSLDDFRSRLERWKMPAADFVFADRTRVRRQRAVLAPVRAGSSGELPTAGWTNPLRWTGWRTLDDLPHTQSGNEFVWAVNGDTAREARLQQLLNQQGPHTADRLRAMQQDVLSTRAAALMPLLERAAAVAADAPAVSARMVAWDRRMTAEAPEAALYRAWEAELSRQLAATRLPPDLVADAARRLPLVELLTAPSRAWFGNSPSVGRDAVLLNALRTVVARQEEGLRHENAPVVFRHPLAISQAAKERFNAGPFEASGDAHTLQAVSSDALVGPGLRMVFDVADWDRSTVINAPGQSGWPDSAHYRDHSGVWASGAQLPLPFSAAAVEANRETALTLRPPQ